MAYGSSQARRWIRATAAGQCHSHSNTVSKPIPQLPATPDPTDWGQGWNPHPYGYSLDLFPLCHNRNSQANIFLLIFCLDDLSFDVSGAIKSATFFVFLSISSFRSVNICFIYFGAPIVMCWYLQMLYPLVGLTLLNYVTLIFVPCYSLCFKVYLSDISIATPAFFCFLFTCNIFFHLSTFSLCVSLHLKWDSFRQHIDGPWFLIHLSTLCLLMVEFSLFIFKVIIGKHILTSILFIAFWLFLYLFSQNPEIVPEKQKIQATHKTPQYLGYIPQKWAPNHIT